MPHTLTLSEIDLLTHDTYRLRFAPVAGLTWTPGQATDMTFDLPGIENEMRPFTFTSRPGDDHIEFVIKSYPDHDGVTARLHTMRPGDRAHVGRPWGAIADRGPGVFIAGGAGITPFIPILRDHARAGAMNCRLIFANTSGRDIMLRKEWDGMDGLATIYVTDAENDGYLPGPVDADLLEEAVPDFTGTFYLCGPPPMVEAVTQALAEHGVGESQIVQESKPSEDERERLFEAA